MPNVDNLIPFSERSKEEAREMGRKGGIASGETRRAKKAMREILKECLEMTNDKGISYKELATLGLIKGAINGSPKNYELICQLLDEIESKDKDYKIDINVIDNSELEKVLYKKD